MREGLFIIVGLLNKVIDSTSKTGLCTERLCFLFYFEGLF